MANQRAALPRTKIRYPDSICPNFPKTHGHTMDLNQRSAEIWPISGIRISGSCSQVTNERSPCTQVTNGSCPAAVTHLKVESRANPGAEWSAKFFPHFSLEFEFQNDNLARAISLSFTPQRSINVNNLLSSFFYYFQHELFCYAFHSIKLCGTFTDADTKFKCRITYKYKRMSSHRSYITQFKWLK